MDDSTLLEESAVEQAHEPAPPPPKMSVRSLDLLYGGFPAL
jgi:hypothetical protein